MRPRFLDNPRAYTQARRTHQSPVDYASSIEVHEYAHSLAGPLTVYLLIVLTCVVAFALWAYA